MSWATGGFLAVINNCNLEESIISKCVSSIEIADLNQTDPMKCFYIDTKC